MKKSDIKVLKSAIKGVVWHSYNENGTWGREFFGDSPLTYQEVEDVVNEYVEKKLKLFGGFEYDKLDRIIVRDLILLKRGTDIKNIYSELWIRVWINGEDIGVSEIKDVWKNRFVEEQRFREKHYGIKVDIEKEWLESWEELCKMGLVDNALYIINNKLPTML